MENLLIEMKSADEKVSKMERIWKKIEFPKKNELWKGIEFETEEKNWLDVIDSPDEIVW